MLLSRPISSKFKGFASLLRQFRSSFNSHSDLENGKLVNVEAVNPKYPLPGFVGIPLAKDEEPFEKKYTPAVHTLPPMKEENYAAALLNVYNEKEFSESQPSIIPPVSDQLECTIHTCPVLVQQALANVFPSRKLSSKPLTALILSHHTNESLDAWSEEAADEREQLARSFITSAIEICSSLKELGYWADFIDPFTGKPYIGSHGEAMFTETDETMKHFGFDLDNSVCCKILRHPKWKNHVFVGLIFTDAPDYHPDYFGIEYDQKVEVIKREENKRKASLSTLKNIIDEQYFGVHDDDDVKLRAGESVKSKKNSSEITVLHSKTSHLDDLCEIDSQYFGSTGSNTNPIENVSSVVNNTTNQLIISQPKIRIGKKHIPHPATTITNANTLIDITLKSNANLRKQEKLVPGTKTIRGDNNIRRNNNDSLRPNKDDNDNRHDDDVEYGSDAVRIIRQRTKLNLYTGTTLDIPSNQSTSSIPEKLDSQGYRVPDEDPYKFDFLTEEEAATVLYKSIIEIRENVITLNKPYGIASQPGAECKHNIVDLLPRIESMIRKRSHGNHGKGEEKCIGELSTVHRLDKDSSGIILIARNKDSALKLQEAFARRWIKKDYLCITVGIPRSDYGYIQLPLVERNFNGIRKMCAPRLNRHLQELTCKQTQLDIGNEANEYDVTDAFSVLYDKMQTNHNQPTTWYHLMDRRNDAALMLCSTLTGIKHQIRAHLAFGLQTPILGDHKYSHAEYLAPQRLPKSLLEVLNIRQSKVRYISLHLHALSLHLHVPPSSSPSPSSNEGFFDFVRSFDNSHSNNNITNNKFIKNPFKFTAPLPNHFRGNLKRIGLKLPHYLKYLH
ncbi:unnamed protein product [Schistosoma margrebowiei]|uniref:Pseudouridine synthase RsuA/RluA-like domain-containing protein n=1 Tax=Schistosoma margrebowiei TaxID=48269 RepID=A0AA85A087_9TREM|nr:unnamed protein product [Schistosoma margrebowiei]